MKRLGSILLLVFTLTATFALAQNPYVKNVIVVIQENRTPDNLFQALCLPPYSNCGTGTGQFNLQSYGLCEGHNGHVPLESLGLQTCADPEHFHSDWTTLYDGGNMDGACQAVKTGCEPLKCTFNSNLDCTRYSYVDNSSLTIQPYLDIATQYGWANNMYQTNQGPSFPAHQFLISGTSSPASLIVPDYTYFAMDNTTGCTGPCSNNEDAGCAATSGELETLISPTGDTSMQIYPCFEHPTLTDLLDNQSTPIPWRYYSGVPNGIWTAPNAINHLCNNITQNGGGSCGSNTQGSQDWKNDVAPYLEGASRNNQPTLAPFLYDMQTCNFQNWSNGGVVFVVPDGRWSDHPQLNTQMGPDWVANIVNAVGNSTCTGNLPNWSNTAILVTWDDWGGWYDHINPIATIGQNHFGYPGGSGNGAQYVYGFRVPLLVVSAYAGTYANGTWSGYISNEFHDFGSILDFIKGTYGITSDIYSTYEYADFFAPDKSNPLGDFFCYPNGGCPARSFTPINLQYSKSCQNSSGNQNGEYDCGVPQNQCNGTGNSQQCVCTASCFINYPGPAEDADTN